MIKITLFEMMEVMASVNKAKIIAHFWNCTCVEHNCVGDLELLLNLKQSNLSRHITKLESLGILTYQKVSKTKYYAINPDFKKQWMKIIDPIIQNSELASMACQACDLHHQHA